MREALDAANAAGPLRTLLAALLLAILLLGEALGGAGACALTRAHGGPAVDEASQLRQGALRDATRLLMVTHAPTQARTAGHSPGDALPATWQAFQALEGQASPAPFAVVAALASASCGRYHARAPPAPA